MRPSVYDALREAMIPLSRIDSALPKNGTIVDLGCGQGIIAKYLARNKKRQLIGVDIDKARLRKSDTKNLKFIYGDITRYPMKNIDGVVMSDVLHHLTPPMQIKVSKNVYKGLKKGGVFVIKEIDTGDIVRSKLSRFWDFVFYPTEKINFQNANKRKKFLERLGFIVGIKKTTKLFPGSTNLFFCVKK